MLKLSRFGVPSILTWDWGAQFTSSVWSEVCSILGISRIKTTSFHPQSNGMIERFHRSLKSSLRARLAGSDWVAHLHLVMLSFRFSSKDDSGLSQQWLFMVLLYLYQASSSNTQNFFRKVFSVGLNERFGFLWASLTSCDSSAST